MYQNRVFRIEWGKKIKWKRMNVRKVYQHVDINLFLSLFSWCFLCDCWVVVVMFIKIYVHPISIKWYHINQWSAFYWIFIESWKRFSYFFLVLYWACLAKKWEKDEVNVSFSVWLMSNDKKWMNTLVSTRMYMKTASYNVRL
jgi:hypothetical protein